MQKFIVSILAVLYLCSSTGATVHLHYCMGKLVNRDLIHKDGDRCSKCGMNKAGAGKGCCKDEHKFIKIEKDQQASQFAYQVMHLLPAAICVSYAELINAPLSAIIEEIVVCNSPPRSRTTIYIRNCIFLI